MKIGATRRGGQSHLGIFGNFGVTLATTLKCQKLIFMVAGYGLAILFLKQGLKLHKYLFWSSNGEFKLTGKAILCNNP